MSSSSYCQGLPSCFEPIQFLEPCVLRIELARNSQNVNKKKNTNERNNFDMSPHSGFSFLQCLSNSIIPSHNNKQQKPSAVDTIYTPPSMKRFASYLSEKSLEMCTESLGSETGSDVSTRNNSNNNNDHDEMDFLSAETEHNSIKNFESSFQERSIIVKGTRRMNKTMSFPPPLTSISGSKSVQVRTHREEGRLVMQAVSAPSYLPYFHAERINGRLKLHLIKDCSNSCDRDEKVAQDDKIEAERKSSPGECVEGNIENVEGESGSSVTNFQRPSRCKEGGGDGGNGSGTKTLLNWEPYWVST